MATAYCGGLEHTALKVNDIHTHNWHSLLCCWENVTNWSNCFIARYLPVISVSFIFTLTSRTVVQYKVYRRTHCSFETSRRRRRRHHRHRHACQRLFSWTPAIMCCRCRRCSKLKRLSSWVSAESRHGWRKHANHLQLIIQWRSYSSNSI